MAAYPPPISSQSFITIFFSAIRNRLFCKHGQITSKPVAAPRVCYSDSLTVSKIEPTRSQADISSRPVVSARPSPSAKRQLGRNHRKRLEQACEVPRGGRECVGTRVYRLAS